MIELGALPAQAEIIADITSDNVLGVAGMGSGKTWAACVKGILLARANHPLVGSIYEPDYPMVRRILLPEFERVFRDTFNNMSWSYHKTEHLLSFEHAHGVSRIRLDGAEDPDKLVGPSIPFAILDEAGKHKARTWEVVPTRVRHPDARVLQFVALGTPDDFGAFYAWCEGDQWDESERGTRRVVHARTYDNWHLPPSPEEYVRRRFGHLSEADRKRYVDGKFVPSGMRVYEYDEKVTARATVTDPFEGEILVGCDFNYGKMCWVLGSRRGERLHVFAELVRYKTITRDQVLACIKLVQGLLDQWRPRPAGYGATLREAADRIIACLDPSARNKSVRASDSDIETFRSEGIREVRYEERTIPVRDRVSSVNWRIREQFLTVDARACPELVKSLRMQGYNLANEPEKADGDADLSGPVDALGYLVWSVPGWRASLPVGNEVTYGTYAAPFPQW